MRDPAAEAIEMGGAKYYDKEEAKTAALQALRVVAASRSA